MRAEERAFYDHFNLYAFVYFNWSHSDDLQHLCLLLLFHVSTVHSDCSEEWVVVMVLEKSPFVHANCK